LSERQDVVTPVRQRGHFQLDDVQAVEQILPESIFADRLAQIRIGRRDDAHACFARDAGAQPLELAGLQHAQQLRLSGSGDVAELVEEQRAAVRRFEAPDPGLRARERARFSAEQLRLHQLAWQRAEVHLEERLVAHGGVGLHDVREHFLACAVRAGDEDRYVRMRNVRGRGHQRVHGIAPINDAAEVIPLRQLGPRFVALLMDGARLVLRASQVQQISHGGEQPCVVPRLGDVVRRTGLHQLHRHFQMSPGGEQNDRNFRIQRPDLAEQRHAFLAARGLAAKVHVLNDQIDVVALERRKPLHRGIGGEHAHAVHRQQHIEGRADGFVVIDDQNGVMRQAGSQFVAHRKSHALRCLRYECRCKARERFSR
jgi:hypothetical protein